MDDRYYGEHLKEISYERIGQFEGIAVFERPDGSRFKRHRRGSHDSMVELNAVDELAARIANLSKEYYDLGNHGDGLPRIGYRESVWLAERLIGWN